MSIIPLTDEDSFILLCFDLSVRRQVETWLERPDWEMLLLSKFVFWRRHLVSDALIALGRAPVSIRISFSSC